MYVEFDSPESFTIITENYLNLQDKAKYRISKQAVSLATSQYHFFVPSRVEVLNTGNRWQQHPVVFARYADPDRYGRGEGELVVILFDGNPIALPFQKYVDKKLYRQAENLGLLAGYISDIKEIK